MKFKNITLILLAIVPLCSCHNDNKTPLEKEIDEVNE